MISSVENKKVYPCAKCGEKMIPVFSCYNCFRPTVPLKNGEIMTEEWLSVAIKENYKILEMLWRNDVKLDLNDPIHRDMYNLIISVQMQVSNVMKVLSLLDFIDKEFKEDPYDQNGKHYYAKDLLNKLTNHFFKEN